MMHSRRSTAWLASLALLLASGVATAKDYSVGDIKVQAPWSQALPPSSETVAAYFIITNTGMNPDRLLGVDTPIAGSAELHRHVHVDGMMKMQQIDTLPIDPEQQVTFAPMNNHVMLLELKEDAPRAEGDAFPLTLHFQNAGDVTVDVEVRRTAPKP